MCSHLAIIHRPLAGVPAKPFVSVPGAVVWTTCVRSIAVGTPEQFAEQLLPTDQVLEGARAYEFLLETVCGLQSPVKGETEVHGQYKIFLEAAKSIVPASVYKTLHQVHVDAKRVRTAHLRDLGSQSYGSYCRRHVRDCEAVNIIGSGHLAHELIPWLAKTASHLTVFCRNAGVKETALKARSEAVNVCELYSTQVEVRGALIIAAPVKSQDVMAWLEKAGRNVQRVIDLRAESAEDPLPVSENVINLKNVFEAIELSRAKIETEVEKARQMIKEMIYANDSAAQNFGPQKRSCQATGLQSRTSA